MRIAGMRVRCDNCGKEVFVERKVDAVMDGGYTRLENYKPLQIGWENWHLIGHTLCTGGYAALLMDYRGGMKPTSMRFYDTDGMPTTVSGYHQIRTTYDLKDNVLTETYYDVDGNPTIAEDKGCASVVYSYDENGRVLKTGYLDTAGQPGRSLFAQLLINITFLLPKGILGVDVKVIKRGDYDDESRDENIDTITGGDTMSLDG